MASALRAQPAAFDPDRPWQPPRYAFTYDTDISSRAGAENLLGAYYFITGWEDRLLPPRWNEENRFLTKAGGTKAHLGHGHRHGHRRRGGERHSRGEA
jgi:hypothetical protein